MADYRSKSEDMAMKNSIEAGLRYLCMLAVILYGIFILLAVGYSVWTLPSVTQFLGTYEWPFTIFIPFPILQIWLSGSILITYYIFIILIILAAFVMLIKDKNSTSNFITLAQLFLAILFFVEAYYWLIGLFSVNYATPAFEQMDFREQLFLLTNACVHEELVCRVLLLGLPLFFLHALTNKARKLRNYILGGNFKLESSAVFLLILSSSIFASAHLAGWDVYKLLPTFITGLALGYLFLRYGLYMSILFHMSFNYLLLIMNMFSAFAPLMTAIYIF